MARLEELERKFEENPRRYFAPLANEYRKAGDAQRAAELCRAQLPAVPGHISGHIVLGQALYDAGDFEGSRAALETALALDPENIVALRYLGDIARSTGDVVEAERWYSRTLEADPYNDAATTALQALRAAPAVELATDRAPQPMAQHPQPTDELSQPTDELPRPTDEVSQQTDDVAAESPEPRSAMEPQAAGFEPTSYAPGTEQSEPAESLSIAPGATAADTSETAALESRPREEPMGSGEFAGDLTVSAAAETAEPAQAEASLPDETAAAAAPPDETPDGDSEPPPQAEPAGRYDVAAHAPAEPDVAADAPHEPAPMEEAIEAEERVLESAAPFVTETMADLYMEQGYPHEALELLLQLAEQRPQDEQLRGKIEHIESVIVARRNAAVAAARAERAETAAATAEAEAATAETEAHAAAAEPGPYTVSTDAPFDAAVAEVDSSAFAAPEPAPAERPLSVREMFARMDRARPRAAGSVTARPISRRRSDFVPMPEARDAGAPEDDPFAFPNPPASAPVPRTSGPHQTFNPSTADNEDFDAWLRGLKGS